MLNIEQQITNWRNELISCEVILPENIDELEDHLRTDIDHLLEKELSAEEAFLIATKRIGGSNNLTSKGRLTLFSLPMIEKRKIAIGLIIVALILIPIFKVITRVITYRLISVESIGVFNQGLFMYKFAVGILLPILWMVILQWLERQRQSPSKI